MKVLIYRYVDELGPVGGPNGYCFNIFKELQKRDNKDISFIPGKRPQKHKSNSLKQYFWSLFRFFIKEKAPIDFDSFDAIHFHSAKDFYKQRKNLKKYKGLIIYTTHSPVPIHMEMIENIKNHHQLIGKLLRKHAFSKIDKYCFNRSDFIVLPCSEAEESYFKHWKSYRQIHDKNLKKYVYIPTGIEPAVAKIKSNEFRKENGYSNDDFIVSYVGRHNEVKGYDRLIEIEKIINDKSIKFLIGGKEFPLKGPKINNWKEIGWTNDPYSLINSSDIFILPNRETYFDIILLEVLSLGKPCLISHTGGNKFVLKDKCPGISGFDSNEDCAKLVVEAHQKEKVHLESLNSTIKEYFNKNFRTAIFVDRYLDFLSGIIE